MTQGRRYRVPDYVTFEVIDGEALILDQREDLLFEFNRVATHIWCSLAEGTDILTLMQGMLVKYDVGEDSVRQDVEILVRELEEKGLLVSANDESQAML